MREILFRGQTRRRGEKVKLNGEPMESNWVYGGILQTDNCERAIIYQQEPEVEKYPVYADTVGQYIGLTDKNGKKIFEGDILRGTADSPAPGKTFIVRWNRMFSRFQANSLEHDGERYNAMIFSESEVIGNIDDNPELMEDKIDE